MLTSTSMRWLVVVAGAAMLLAVVAACAGETVEVPGETVVVKEEVIKEVQVPGETVVVEKEVIKEVMVPGETVTKEVIKEVEVPGQTVVVEKEVVKTVEVPGQTVVVEKVVVKEVPEQKYVTDPTTGKVVSAPEYGGTFTYVRANMNPSAENKWGPGGLATSVTEPLAIADWGLDRREVFDHMKRPTPLWVMKGHLAESWEMPDDTTIIFHIRKGVHWHDKAPMNGRELTAQDIEYGMQRWFGVGKFSELEPFFYLKDLPTESVTATDDSTVVFKLTKPHFDPVNAIFNRIGPRYGPPEVMEQEGGMKDWKSVVGTGPYELTDFVEGTSVTWTKVPGYWGFDEKFPENRLPYIDKRRVLIIKDEATKISALRTGKLDYMGWIVGSALTVDQMEGVKKTHPEMQFLPYSYRSDFTSFAMNVTRPPFDDIRVRKAMQMALPLEEINSIYFKGWAMWKPQGVVGIGATDHFTPFDEWPEEVKKGYMYDPEGAEKLLDEAGYPRGADGIRFKVVHEQVIAGFLRGIVAYSELASGYWAKIGVDVEVTAPMDQTGQTDRIKNYTFDMINAVSGYDFNPLNLISRWRSGEGGHTAYPGFENPQLDSLIDAAEAATTLEEQQRAVKEADAYIVKNHHMVWFFRVPRFNAFHPWVVGYNGEFYLGFGLKTEVFDRLWIDSEKKAAMGY